MTKKLTALFFLYVACITMLVFAVVPHHHHNGSSICLTSTHCEEQDEHEKCSHNAHSPYSEDESCEIKQLFQSTNDRNVKTSLADNGSSNANILSATLFMLSDIYKILLIEAEKESSIPPYCEVLHSVNIRFAWGTRAPPSL